MRYVAILLFALMTTACAHWSGPAWLGGASKEDAIQAQSKDLLLGTRWIAEEIGGAPVGSEIRTTFNVDVDGKLNGRGGCNSYFATGDFSAGLRIEALGSTKMACLAPLMEQENRFFDALHRVRGFAIDEGGKLRVMDAAGATLAVLGRP